MLEISKYSFGGRHMRLVRLEEVPGLQQMRYRAELLERHT
jgi:hypothetical protein